jgi:DNA-binding MarR family transcriptional regulator
MPRTAATSELPKSAFEQLSEFRYQIRRYERFSENATKEEGLTPLQYLLMLHIKGYPGREWATVGELAERLQAQHHGVVALISRCEAMGIVVRSSSPDDRRVVEVRVTDAGEAILTRLAVTFRAELKALRGTFFVPDLPDDSS